MTRVLLFCLLLTPAVSAVAQDSPIPRLGHHQFVPATAIDEPFITTDVQTTVSLGQTVNSSLPVFDPTDSTIVGSAKANVVLAGIGFRYQQRVKDWLAVQVRFGTTGRVGTSTTTLLSEGLTGALNYRLAWLLRMHQSETFLLSGSLSLGNSSSTFINLLDWARGILEGVNIPLVRSRPSLVGTAGVHAGWGLSRRFGLLGSFTMSYGESFDGFGENSWDHDGRLAVSYDMAYDLGLPLGLSVAGGHYDSNERSSSLQGIWFWSLRLALQTRDDFSIGLDLSTYYTEKSEYDTRQQIGQFSIDMRYYY
jgi:hypothetical protein